MVWEQHLELILMLTNLEEYSKTKCAKYWPDEADGDKMHGDFGVAHVREKRYSGLLVALLHVTVLHIFLTFACARAHRHAHVHIYIFIYLHVHVEIHVL
jgi:protein tyrosine phosphatase